MSEHLWAVVLAAGEGRRLAALTERLHGVPVPKQFAADAGWSDLGSPDRVFSALGRTGELGSLEERLRAAV
jgi:hypothetical protein